MPPKLNLIRTILDAAQAPGVPDYRFLSSKRALSAYEDALRKSLKEAEQTLESILKIKPKDARFQNVTEAVLNMDEPLDLLWSFLRQLNSAKGSDETRGIIGRMKPEIVAFSSRVLLSEKLFRLLQSARRRNGITERKRATDLLLRDMRLAGVALPEQKKQRLKQINKRLSILTEQFTNNVLASQQKFSHHFLSDGALEEMPAQEGENAKREARRRGKKGWIFTLSPPSYVAIMRYCADRRIRRRFFTERNRIASHGKTDNQPIILAILKLRREKARLLGLKNYACFALQSRMARSVEGIRRTFLPYEKLVLQKARMEVKELKNYAKTPDLQSWDTAFYGRLLKQERLRLDPEELRQYFPLEQALPGMFAIVRKLYNVRFRELKVSSYDPDVRTYEVQREGKNIGYLAIDLFARPEKRPGAWCEPLRGRRVRSDGTMTLPIVTFMANCGKAEKRTTLLTHMETTTLFHEFGHAVHALLGEQKFANTSGWMMEWDFVELPSQLMENWCFEKEALDLFARHWKTGRKMPDRLFGALQKSRTFLNALNRLYQCELQTLDLSLHTKPVPRSVTHLDRACLTHAKKYSILPTPDSYRMYTSFSHIFGGGYAAGYYSYLWAEMLEADVFSKFQRHGILNPSVGEEFRKSVLSQGTMKPARELFRAFMRRKPDAEALIKREEL